MKRKDLINKAHKDYGMPISQLESLSTKRIQERLQSAIDNEEVLDLIVEIVSNQSTLEKET